MKHHNNNIYKVDIFFNLLCLYQLKYFAEEHKDLSELSCKIIDIARKYGYTKLFDEEEFILTHDRIDRMFSAVSKALFLRNQKNYYSRYTDVLTILLANNLIHNEANIINYITDNLKTEHQIHLLPKFKKMAELGRPLIKREANKIRFYLNRKMSAAATAKHKVLEATAK